MKITEIVNIIADGVTDKIEFAKSCGVKCDSVGWMKFDVERDKELLLRVRQRADAENAFLRGSYEKTISEVDTQWYILKPAWDLPIDDYGSEKLDGVYVPLLLKPQNIPKGCHVFRMALDRPGVSEQFVDAYNKHGLTGLEFCWFKDKGRYEVPSYYYPVAVNMTSRVAGEIKEFRKVEYTLDKNLRRYIRTEYDYDKSMVRELYKQSDSIGGNLLFMDDIFDEIQFAPIPFMVDYDEMPDSDFAYLFDCIHHKKILIRDTAAQKLIDEGVLDKRDLVPVLPFSEELHSKLITKGVEELDDILKIKDLLQEKQTELAKKKRKDLVITEKLALQMLRRNKQLRPERYKSCLKKAIQKDLTGTQYEKMTPYYNVSDGAKISKNMEYYSYDEAQKETESFVAAYLKGYNPLENIEAQNIVVIGKAYNNDVILLTDSEKVIQFNVDKSERIKAWDYLHEFFYENTVI